MPNFADLLAFNQPSPNASPNFSAWQGFQAPMAMSAMPVPPPVQGTPTASSLVQPRIPPAGLPPRPALIKPMPVMTPELQASIDAIKGQREASRAVQEQGLGAMEADLAAALSRDFQTDVSPLAALVNEWSNSNVGNAYQRPESVQDRKKEISGLEAAIGRGRTGLEEAELANLESDLKMNLGIRSEERKDEAQFQRDKVSNWYKDQELALQRERLENERVIKEQRAKGGGIAPQELLSMRTKLGESSSGKRVKGITQFMEGLNEYEKLVAEHGVNPRGEAGARLSTAYTKMSTAFKTAEELGALAGPDLKLLRDNVTNTGDIGAAISATFKGVGKNEVIAQIRQARKGFDDNYRQSYAELEDYTQDIPEIRNMILGYQDRYNKVSKDSAIGQAEEDDLRKAAEEKWLRDNGMKKPGEG